MKISTLYFVFSIKKAISINISKDDFLKLGNLKFMAL